MHTHIKEQAILSPARDDLLFPKTRVAAAVLAVLMLANILSFIDRLIISLLIDPIRRDLSMSDVEAGLLMGPTFTIFHALMGLPLGKLIDRRTRVRIVAVAVALWSLMTILGGLSQSDWQLFITRIGVAVGEAVVMPAASSLLADCFPLRLRARAIGLFALTTYVGAGLALLFGGGITALAVYLKEVNALPWYLSSLASWQICLIMVGIPGIPLAFTFGFFIREPARLERSKIQGSDRPESMISWRGLLWQRLPVFACHFLGFSLIALVAVTVLAWAPAALGREYGIATAQVGLWLGLAVMSAGILGTGISAYTADRMVHLSIHDGKFRIGAACAALGLTCALASSFSLSALGFVICIAGMICAVSGGMGISIATILDVVPNELRGQAVATYQMIGAGVAGMGVPLAAYISSSVLAGAPIRIGLALVSGVAFAISAAAFLGGRRAFGAAVRDHLATRLQPETEFTTHYAQRSIETQGVT